MLCDICGSEIKVGQKYVAIEHGTVSIDGKGRVRTKAYFHKTCLIELTSQAAQIKKVTDFVDRVFNIE